MFLKNKMRPAVVGFGESSNQSNKRFSPIMFSGESDDASSFGGFDNETERRSAPRSSGSSKGGNGGAKMSKKAYIIAISVAVAVVILISAVAVALIAGGGINLSGNITYKDNAYMTYVDANGQYHLLANGKLMDSEVKFKGEVQLVPAADNSFAYVFDYADDGCHMYVVEGKKIKSILNTPVEEVLATASLKPGVVYAESTNTGMIYMLYTEKNDEEIIDIDRSKPENFLISGDAKTVVYTSTGLDSSDRELKLFNSGKDSSEDSLTTTSCVPVAISNYGDYIYIKRYNENNTPVLSVIDLKKDKRATVKNSENFLAILEMNVDGDEVIFCTGNGGTDTDSLAGGTATDVKTMLYRHTKSADKSVVKLGTGIITTATVDASVSVHKNFKDTYFVSALIDETAGQKTYYVNSRYEDAVLVSEYAGKFDPDAKYFYYVDADGILQQIDLGKGDYASRSLYGGVADFVVTEKGNVYYIEDGGDSGLLCYTKPSVKNGRQRVSYYAMELSFYNCANMLYFSEIDSNSETESEKISYVKESNQPESAKFGSDELSVIPYFSNPNSSKCYAVVYNETKDSYAVYYTSNGKRFSLVKDVTNCADLADGITLPTQD